MGAIQAGFGERRSVRIRLVMDQEGFMFPSAQPQAEFRATRDARAQ